jgi:hypothetical protein
MTYRLCSAQSVGGIINSQNVFGPGPDDPSDGLFAPSDISTPNCERGPALATEVRLSDCQSTEIPYGLADCR